MKKFRDYIIEEYGELYGSDYILTVHNVLKPFARARADGIKSLEVSKKEYAVLVYYFALKVSWTSKKIWGIKLIIV